MTFLCVITWLVGALIIASCDPSERFSVRGGTAESRAFMMRRYQRLMFARLVVGGMGGVALIIASMLLAARHAGLL